MQSSFKKTIIIVGVVVCVLAFLKYRSISAAIAQGAAFAQPPESVTTQKVALSSWAPSFTFVGTVYGERAVTLKAEEAGRIDAINFTSGDQVSEGHVLVQLDVTVEQGNLQAAKAKAKLAQFELVRKQKLFESKVASQSEIDIATAESEAAAGDAKALEAMIRRKSIIAPFNGKTGVRMVSLGEYVTAGKEVVTISDNSEQYVLFHIPQNIQSQLQKGFAVEFVDTETGVSVGKGVVQSIDTIVQQGSRMSAVRASITEHTAPLVSGSFIRARVILPSQSKAIIVPSSSVSYAPYGDSIYVIVRDPTGKDLSVRQQFVKIGEATGNFVTVIEGLKEGDEVVTTGSFKLHPGAKVQIHNDKAIESLSISPPDT